VNLCFLVEGAQTEKHVYRAWLKHTFPGFSEVSTTSAMNADTYCIIAGHGNPQYKKRIPELMEDFRTYPAIDHFFICVDAESKECAEVVEEIEAEIVKHIRAEQLSVHIILQNCCIETWFLGHTALVQQAAEASKLSKLLEFFDVSRNDPEHMGPHPDHPVKAHFHEEYLKELFLAQDPRQRYRKKNPGLVLEKPYLDALRARCSTTSHLPSLQKLFTTWDALVPTSPPAP
jgi:phenylpyruvate tautomerase PptA (4-oxalocrotonate tautomerase family)